MEISASEWASRPGVRAGGSGVTGSDLTAYVPGPMPEMVLFLFFAVHSATMYHATD